MRTCINFGLLKSQYLSLEYLDHAKMSKYNNQQMFSFGQVHSIKEYWQDNFIS